MKRYNLYFKLLFFIFLPILFESLSASKLKNVYLHKEALAGDHLVFYFSDPVKFSHFKPKVSGKPNLEAMTWLFDDSFVKSKGCKKAIQKVNSSRFNGYGIRIKQLKKSKPVIMLTIVFDSTKKVVFTDTFKSISSKYGFVFHICNKGVSLEKETDFTIDKNKKPVVVVDSGHGGKDSGTVSPNGLKEKDIAQSVGRYLQKMLVDGGVDVCVTRKGDEFLPLDQRTFRANRCKNADLFVSIHANGAGSKEASGIETFFSDSSLFDRKYFPDGSFDAERFDEFVLDKKNKNKTLAESVHSNLLRSARSYDIGVMDRSVKRNVSQVLFGTKMPSILVELGFLSNVEDAKRLSKQEYQKKLASGIYNGIIEDTTKRFRVV